MPEWIWFLSTSWTQIFLYNNCLHILGGFFLTFFVFFDDNHSNNIIHNMLLGDCFFIKVQNTEYWFFLRPFGLFDEWVEDSFGVFWQSCWLFSWLKMSHIIYGSQRQGLHIIVCTTFCLDKLSISGKWNLFELQFDSSSIFLYEDRELKKNIKMLKNSWNHDGTAKICLPFFWLCDPVRIMESSGDFMLTLNLEAEAEVLELDPNAGLADSSACCCCCSGWSAVFWWPSNSSSSPVS